MPLPWTPPPGSERARVACVPVLRLWDRGAAMRGHQFGNSGSLRQASHVATAHKVANLAAQDGQRKVERLHVDFFGKADAFHFSSMTT